MHFWVLENAAGNYVQIHVPSCERCLDGTKSQPGSSWTGFEDYAQAMEHATVTNRPVLQCTTCHPERYA
ncbi:MAG: hypothetical protein JW846_01265 [Dehalococcoidia bacterium]|nr:hypothetical protein [Dehalococcoidia bacterium]